MERKPLPEEILAIIVESLRLPPPHIIASSVPWGLRSKADHYAIIKEKLRTLVSLSRVSRALHRIAEPLLYEVFPGQSMAKAHLWLAALVAKPHRLDLVRGVVIEGHDAYEDVLPGEKFRRMKRLLGPRMPDAEWPELTTGIGGFDDWFKMLDDQHEVKQVCEESSDSEYTSTLLSTLLALRRVSMPDDLRERLTKPLNAGHVDGVLSALVLICRNIEAVDLGWCVQWIGTLLQTSLILRFANFPPQSTADLIGQEWSTLKRLDVRRKAWDHCFFEADMTWYSLYPILKRAPVLGTHKISFPKDNLLGPSAWTNLQMNSIHLQDLGGFDDNRMPRILLSTQSNLQSLSLVEEDRDTSIKTLLNSTCRLGDALRIYCHNLEHLTLYSAKGRQQIQSALRPGCSERGSVATGVGSLCELTKLKSLTATLWELLGYLPYLPKPHKKRLRLHKILPKSIEEVTILWTPLNTQELWTSEDPAVANLWRRVICVYIDNISRLLLNKNFPSLWKVQLYVTNLIPHEFYMVGWNKHVETVGDMDLHTFVRDERVEIVKPEHGLRYDVEHFNYPLPGGRLRKIDEQQALLPTPSQLFKKQNHW